MGVGVCSKLVSTSTPPPRGPDASPSMPPPPRVRLGTAAGLVFLVQVAGAGLSYVLHIVFARSMSTTGYGVFAYVLGVAGLLASLATLGLPGTALRFIRMYLGRAQVDRVGALWRWALRRLRRAGLIIAFTGGVFGIILSLAGRPTQGMLLSLAGVLVIALASSEWSSAVARSLEHPLLAYVPQLVLRPAVAMTAALLLVARGSLSATVSIGVFTAAATIVAALQFGGVSRRIKHLGERASVGLDAPPDSLSPTAAPGPDDWRSVALGLWGFSALALGLSHANLILLGALRGAEEVALYNAAGKTAWLAAFVLMAVNAVIGPYFGALHDRDDRAGLQQLLRKAMRWIAWPTFLIVGSLVASSPWILGWFGPSYRVATPILLVLAIGALVNALSGPVALLLNTTGHQARTTRAYAWCLAGNLFMGVPLILFFGALGAAVADTLILTLWNLWLTTLVRRELTVDPTVLQLLRRG